MAVTISNLQDNVNLYIRDSGTDSVTAADRLDAITEATRQLYNDFGFDFTNRTYSLDYFDGIHYYDITTDVPDFSEPADLRRKEGDHTENFTRKTPREIAVEIDNGDSEKSFAIEYKNQKAFLVVNHPSKYSAGSLHDCDSLTANGTWSADTSTSDATNLTADTVEKNQGSASLNFDIDVSQSGNNRAIISNSDMSSRNLSSDENLSTLAADIWIPDVTTFTSVTSYWGSSSSAYWSGVATTDILTNSFSANEWNTIGVAWADSAATGSGDASAINYLRFDFNYEAGQGDDTDFRIDNIRMVRPEVLKLHYETWAIGVTSTSDSTLVYDFTVATNVPFFSGTYDYFAVYVAHLAAAILFRKMGLTQDSTNEEQIAARELDRLKRKFPTSQLRPTKNFKVKGLRW